MKEEENGSAPCDVINQIIWQGTPTAQQICSADPTGTAGCAIITEFVGLGRPTSETVAQRQRTEPKTETSHPSAPPPAP